MAIYCFDLKGNLVGVYASIAEASAGLGVGKAIITANLNGKSKRAHSYVFSRHSKFPGYDNRKRNTRVVDCYDPTGKYITTYESVLAAADKTGVDYKRIYTMCNDPESFDFKINKYKENPELMKDPYLWRYSSTQRAAVIIPRERREPKYVYQMYGNGEVVKIYESCAEAARVTNLQRQAIHACCTHPSQTAGGFGWTYDPKAYKQYKDGIQKEKDRQEEEHDQRQRSS